MNEGSSSAVDAVRRYVAAHREIRGRLFADLAGITDVRDLMSAVRSRRTMARQGRSTSGIEYAIHGAGCRMTDEHGRVVDVDLVTDPRRADLTVEAFDAWRINGFLSSDRQGRMAADDLNVACAQLAACGELRVVGEGRWFALPSSVDG